MDDNIVQFNGFTKLDLNPKSILTNIAESNLDQCIVIGVKDGEQRFYSSIADESQIIYMIEVLKHKLLNGDFA